MLEKNRVQKTFYNGKESLFWKIKLKGTKWKKLNTQRLKML